MVLSEYDLTKFFNPKSIAIVGVSRGEFRLGGMSFLKKLQIAGFPGNIYPINPKSGEIRGLKSYPNLEALPEVPDLAMLCVAARVVPNVLEECASLGLRHIHILTAGFKEIGTVDGRNLEARILSIAKEKGLLVIGPNCMGPYSPSSHLTAWGAIPGLAGPLGIISQSGGITQRLTEYTCSLGVGVEKAVSFGNAAVLDSTDYLEFMGGDERIKVIAMYLESVKDGREFLGLVREVNKKKPVILWKGGESEVGALTAASHTGAMFGEQRLWEAFYRQTGAIRVRSMDEWVDAILAFCLLPMPKGKGVFLIGGGGGNSVGNSDTCVREGLEVPPLSKLTMDKLRKSVPMAGSIAGNPLDMFRIFQDAAYLREVLELAYHDPVVSMAVVDRLIPREAFHLPDLPDSTPDAIKFVEGKGHQKPTVFTLDSEGGDTELAQQGTVLRAQVCNAGIPAYPSLNRAARALAHLCRYSEFKRNC